MRLIARSCLVVVLVIGLLDIPGFAANEKPLGLVLQAQEASVDNAKLAVGTTVFPGDTVETDTGGTLRLKLGTNQLYLLASSAATLAQNSTIVHAVVAHGTVGFASNGADKIELEIPEGILRAADGVPSYGQVTITSPVEVVISAYRGTLVLDNEGELHTIPAGKSYRVTMDLEPAAVAPTAEAAAQDSQSANAQVVQPRKRRRKKLAFYLIFTGALAGLTYAVWDELTESPTKTESLEIGTVCGNASWRPRGFMRDANGVFEDRSQKPLHSSKYFGRSIRRPDAASSAPTKPHANFGSVFFLSLCRRGLAFRGFRLAFARTTPLCRLRARCCQRREKRCSVRRAKSCAGIPSRARGVAAVVTCGDVVQRAFHARTIKRRIQITHARSERLIYAR